jgi:hypothetical protein
MKFTLQIEVDAEECINENFSKDTHAREWFYDMFKDARTLQYQFILDYLTKNKKANSNDPYIQALVYDINTIDKVMQTIKSV